jgi:serine/threonine protein kinase
MTCATKSACCGWCVLLAAPMAGRRHDECAVQLDHPNVIKLVEYYEDASASQMYLVLEYCSGGELFDQLKAQPGDKFPEPVAALLVHQMVSAVAYCHRMGIAHRDLKLENFLFEKPWTSKHDIPLLKLIDFGLSRKYVLTGGAIRRMKSMVRARL